MDFNKIQSLWHSIHNQPTASDQQKLIQNFMNKLRRQRRNQLIWLCWTFLQLTVITGFACWLIFATNKVSLKMEWALIPLLLLLWSATFFFLKQFRKPSAQLPQANAPIAEALTASLTANNAARLRLKAIACLYVLILPLLAVAMWQLHTAGKASPRELTSMAILFGCVLAVSGITVAAKYFFRLVPQQKHLQELLHQYEDNTNKC